LNKEKKINIFTRSRKNIDIRGKIKIMYSNGSIYDKNFPLLLFPPASGRKGSVRFH
jgi:hypothetical protein